MKDFSPTLNSAKLAEIYLAAEGDISCGGHLVGLRAVADYVLEEAAKLCDETSDLHANGEDFMAAAEYCASEIRGLKEVK